MQRATYSALRRGAATLFSRPTEVSPLARRAAAPLSRGMCAPVQISAAMVKELREKTGSPMMDCKKALQEGGGDHAKALEWLRKKGMATAAKKESRRSADGLICALIDASGKRGSVVEINAETDFVARNPIFQEFVKDVCALHLKAGPGVSLDAFKALMLPNGPQTKGEISVDAAVKEMVATVGENCQMRSCDGVEVKEGGVFKYIHTPMGDNIGKVGVLVALECATSNKEALSKLGVSLAMHVAAGKPLYNTAADIPEADTQAEKKIYLAQAQESGKPADIAEKMTVGRIKKWHDEVVLHEQEYLLGGEEKKMKVSKVLANAEKELGAKVKLTGFVRIKCGEKTDDA